jgi:N-acyl-D-amino-acid deacylase
MPLYDLLIRDATVMPGDGPGLRTDVAVVGDRIAEVAASISRDSARNVVAGDGLMLCPGFIDLHAHSALEPFRDPRMIPKIAQGFTTEVVNPDGLSPAPVRPDRWSDRRAYMVPLEGPGPDRWTWSTVAEYLEALDAARPATTLVPSVGHNAVRDVVLGGTSRAPDDRELRAMRDEVRKGLEAGARMLSFGLIYAPGIFARTEELIALASEAARFGAPVAVHVRNEAAGVLDSVAEMVGVARSSGAPLHISHLKAIGDASLVSPLLELIDRARSDVDVTFDHYPYGAGTTTLATILPPWALEGGIDTIVERLGDMSERRAIVRAIQRGVPGWENPYRTEGAGAFVVAQAGPPREADTGKTLDEIAEERAVDPLVGALDLLAETRLAVTSIDHYATEDTVREIFRHPLALVGSDGIFSARPHPRLYGTAARVLGRYALRERVIPVEDGVARLTARAADRVSLADRGRIRRGLRADLVLMDPARFVDTATYEDPAQVPDGVHLVVVGGKTVWESGQPHELGAGGVLRDPLPVTQLEQGGTRSSSPDSGLGARQTEMRGSMS